MFVALSKNLPGFFPETSIQEGLLFCTLKLLYFTWPLRMAEKNKTHFVKNEFNFTSILHVFKKF